MHKYEIIIYWSNDDQAFIAEVPELPGCTSYGKSPDEALANCKDAMDLSWTLRRSSAETSPRRREDDSSTPERGRSRNQGMVRIAYTLRVPATAHAQRSAKR